MAHAVDRWVSEAAWLRTRFAIHASHMDALRLLTEDQSLIDEFLQEARSAKKSEEKRLLFNDSFELLTEHMESAEKILYAQLKRDSETLMDLLQKQIEIHDQLKRFGRRLTKNRDLRDFSNQLENFLRRVQMLFEREEHQVFPAIWKKLTDLQLLQLGTQIQAAREPASNLGTPIDEADDAA